MDPPYWWSGDTLVITYVTTFLRDELTLKLMQWKTSLLEASAYRITFTMSLQDWMNEKNEPRITTVKKLNTGREIQTISPVSKLRKKIVFVSNSLKKKK